MAKNMKRILAMLLVMVMFVSVLPMQALAADGDGITYETSPEGLPTVVDTQTTGEGTPVVTVTVEKTTTGTYTDSEGTEITVNRTETNEVTTTENADGSTSEVTVDSGNEEKKWNEEVEPGDTVPDVVTSPVYETNEDGTVKTDEDGNPIIKTTEDGAVVIGGSATETYTDSDGEKPQPGDINYNYTETNTTVSREVEGTIKVEQSYSANGFESTLECPRAPENYEGKDYYDYSDDACDSSDPNKDYDTHYREGLLIGEINKKTGELVPYDKDSLTGVVAKENDENYDASGHDMTWTGYGDFTNSAAPVFLEKIVFVYEYEHETNEDGTVKTDADGNPIVKTDAEGKPIVKTDADGNPVIATDEYGDPIIDMVNSTFMRGSSNGTSKMLADKATGGKVTGMISTPVQFALQHVNGNYFYAYCMDAATGASPTKNKWYSITNIEDAIYDPDTNPDGHLSVEEAAMIRSIATNGYWGSESGKGSLEDLKELLRSTYDEDDQITVRYPNTYDVHVDNIYDLIDGLTEAEALVVTQSAIWAYANSDDFGGVPGAGIASILSASKYHNGGILPERDISQQQWLAGFRPAYDYDSDVRMQALYKALLGLAPIYADGELREDSTVIPRENAITDVTLVINDKVEEHADNMDENKDNDVYNTDVSFKLSYEPGAEDEMYICLVGADNQPIKGEDDQPIRKRVVAETSTEEGDDILKPVDGVYTLSGLQISENTNFQFDLVLDGTQYLNEGVYIYQAAGPDGNPSRDASQTLVGLAKGEQKVTVRNKVTVNFNVDEEKSVVQTRVWRSENDPVITPPSPPEVPNDPPVVWNRPPVTQLANDEVEIPEEPVPLAAPVTTGDTTSLWIIAMMVIVCGMVVINVFDKKRNYEAF